MAPTSSVSVAVPLPGTNVWIQDSSEWVKGKVSGQNGDGELVVSTDKGQRQVPVSAALLQNSDDEPVEVSSNSCRSFEVLAAEFGGGFPMFHCHEPSSMQGKGCLAAPSASLTCLQQQFQPGRVAGGACVASNTSVTRPIVCFFSLASTNEPLTQCQEVEPPPPLYLVNAIIPSFSDWIAVEPLASVSMLVDLSNGVSPHPSPLPHIHPTLPHPHPHPHDHHAGHD
jgi:hypothetical protein